MDITAGGTNPYSTMGFWVCGIPNVGDSLAVIKKLVFEDKKVSLARLCEALDKDFEDDDELLHLITQVPKYGNDDDYVDLMVNQVLLQLDGEVSKYTAWGGSKLHSRGGRHRFEHPLRQSGRRSTRRAQGGTTAVRGRHLALSGQKRLRADVDHEVGGQARSGAGRAAGRCSTCASTPKVSRTIPR